MTNTLILEFWMGSKINKKMRRDLGSEKSKMIDSHERVQAFDFKAPRTSK